MVDKFLGMDKDQFAANVEQDGDPQELHANSIASVLCLLSAVFEKLPPQSQEGVHEAFSSLLDSHAYENENAPNSTNAGSEGDLADEFSIEMCISEAKKLSEHFRMAVEAV